MQFLALALLIYVGGVVSASPILNIWDETFPSNDRGDVILKLRKGDFAYAILHNTPEEQAQGATPYKIRLVYGGHLGIPPELPEGNEDLADNVAVLVYETAIKPFPTIVAEIEQQKREHTLDKELNME